jgi:hypothetical protein
LNPYRIVLASVILISSAGEIAATTGVFCVSMAPLAVFISGMAIPETVFRTINESDRLIA